MGKSARRSRGAWHRTPALAPAAALGPLLLFALVAACSGARAVRERADAQAGAGHAGAPIAPRPDARTPDGGASPVATTTDGGASPVATTTDGGASLDPRPTATPPDAGAPADPLGAFRAAALAVRAGQADRLVRVAQLGDSHTAGEAFTGRLRQLLQAELGDGGHGFVVPGWADARLHRGVILRDDGRWTVSRVRYAPVVDPGDRLFGIGAVGVRGGAEGAWMQLTARGARFDVYYLEAPGGGSFEARLDQGEPIRITTAAAAPRAAFHTLQAPRGRHVLELRLVGDGEVRLFGVEVEQPGPGLVYASLGVTGARTTTPLEWDEGLFVEQLRRLAPDLVVTMYGTNDLFADDYSADGFASSLRRLLSRVRAATPGASCLVLAPPDVARAEDGGPLASVPALPELVQRAQVEAERAGCGFWDTLSAMGGPGAILAWGAEHPALAARDRVHLTRPGYERLADALANDVLLPATR